MLLRASCRVQPDPARSAGDFFLFSHFNWREPIKARKHRISPIQSLFIPFLYKEKGKTAETSPVSHFRDLRFSPARQPLQARQSGGRGDKYQQIIRSRVPLPSCFCPSIADQIGITPRRGIYRKDATYITYVLEV